MAMNIYLARLQSAGIAADRVVVTVSKGDFTRTLEGKRLANHLWNIPRQQCLNIFNAGGCR